MNKINSKFLKNKLIKFHYKTFYYSNIPLYSWFEVEYRIQINQDSWKNQLNNIINLFSFKKNFETFFILSVLLMLFLFYINYVFHNFYTLIIGSDSDSFRDIKLVFSSFDLILDDIFFTKILNLLTNVNNEFNVLMNVT